MTQLSDQIKTNLDTDCRGCLTPDDIKMVMQNYGSYDHPYIYDIIGITSGVLKFNELSLNAFLRAISYGLKFPNPYWNTIYSDSIGSSIARIIFFLKIECPNALLQNLYSLCYGYLSSCIELLDVSAFESLDFRGRLLNSNSQFVANMIQGYLGLGIFPKVMVISDYYYSSIGYTLADRQDLAQNALNRARQCHRYLEDISVVGKCANEWTLEDIAKIGAERNKILYSRMQSDLKANKFEIKEEELMLNVRLRV
jgi:hypothetical protein